MKFRTVGSPIFNDIYAALGANPTQMSFADAQPALQSGAVDGQENPVSIFVAAKMTGLNQKYLTKWNYVNDPLVFAVSQKAWKSWSPEDQKIGREAAIEAARAEIADARKGVTGSDDALVIISTHLIAGLESLFDECVVLHDGRVLLRLRVSDMPEGRGLEERIKEAMLHA